MSIYEAIFERAKKQGYPAYYDHDYICNVCGELWDSYGIRNGDMTKQEAEDFFKGKGCPSCRHNKEAT